MSVVGTIHGRVFFPVTLRAFRYTVSPPNASNPNTTAASSAPRHGSTRDTNTPSSNHNHSDDRLQQQSFPPQDANSLRRPATLFAPSESTNWDGGASSRISVDFTTDSLPDFLPMGSMSPDELRMSSMVSDSRSYSLVLQPSLPEGLRLALSSSYEQSGAWVDGLRLRFQSTSHLSLD
jgi:hypothetical protein